VHEHTEILVKGTLSLIALAVVLWRHLQARGLDEARAGIGLALMAAVAVIAYPNFGKFHGRGDIHHWEQFHYFLGSKYFPELRYDGIYAASIAAEREMDLSHPPQSHVRDLRTNDVVPLEQILVHAREVEQRFSPERWRSFSDDVRYFLESSSYDYITRIRKDHGYNPTPTWTFSARLFSLWPAAGDTALSALAWIDPLLLGVMFVFVFRAFGARVGCLSLVIFGLGYPWRFDWVGGAFLRQDWLAAVGIGICMLRSKRFTVAGMLFAYAAMVRVFPGGFLVGPAVVAVRHLAGGESIRWFRELIVGLAAGVAICLVAGSLTGLGVAAWPQFIDNLEKHHETWLTNNVGMKNVFLYDGPTMRREDVNWQLSEPWIIWQGKMNRLENERRPLLLGATVVMLCVAAAAAWRCRPEQAAVLGTAVAFAVVVLTCYYWVMLLLVPLGRGRWGPTAGWLAINTGLYGLHLMTPAFEMRYGLMSWALLVFFLAWLLPDTANTAMKLTRRIRGTGDRGAA
jgi:hypothetical protein